MANFNQVNLAGTIGRIDTFTTNSGVAIVTINLAVTKYKKVGDGFEDSTNWFTIKMFGVSAENASTKFVVGDSVLLTGELDTNVYEKDGIKTYQTYVVTNKLVLCKYGKNNPKANQSSAPGNVQPAPAQQFNMNYAGGDTGKTTVEGWDNDSF